MPRRSRQAVHVQVAARAPLHAGHTAQPGGSQHQRGLAIGECADRSRSSSHFAKQLSSQARQWHDCRSPHKTTSAPRKQAAYAMVSIGARHLASWAAKYCHFDRKSLGQLSIAETILDVHVLRPSPCAKCA